MWKDEFIEEGVEDVNEVYGIVAVVLNEQIKCSLIAFPVLLPQDGCIFATEVCDFRGTRD